MGESQMFAGVRSQDYKNFLRPEGTCLEYHTTDGNWPFICDPLPKTCTVATHQPELIKEYTRPEGGAFITLTGFFFT